MVDPRMHEANPMSTGVHAAVDWQHRLREGEHPEAPVGKHGNQWATTVCSHTKGPGGNLVGKGLALQAPSVAMARRHRAQTRG